MHIPDGVLSTPVLVTTSVFSAVGVAYGLKKIDDECIPKAAMLAAVFFVASLIHVPIGPASSHLLLNGLMGLLIGWAAFPAILIGLLLQAVFFGFGGVTSLGANVFNMGLPAILTYLLFASQMTPAASQKKVFGLACLAGAFSILLTCLCGSLTLLASGKEFMTAVTAIVLAHLPIMVIEGFVTGFVMVFLYKVRPELLVRPVIATRQEEKLYA
jgi:cobalt/nickel transport system permease protein